MTGYALTRAAHQDLREIGAYIASDNPAAARRVIGRLHDAFAALAERPGIGHMRTDLTLQDVRFWTVRGRHVIVYREHADDVEILRILAAGRDISALLDS